jgi:hypothetical protein
MSGYNLWSNTVPQSACAVEVHGGSNLWCPIVRCLRQCCWYLRTAIGRSRDMTGWKIVLQAPWTMIHRDKCLSIARNKGNSFRCRVFNARRFRNKCRHSWKLRKWAISRFSNGLTSPRYNNDPNVDGVSKMKCMSLHVFAVVQYLDLINSKRLPGVALIEMLELRNRNKSLSPFKQ